MNFETKNVDSFKEETTSEIHGALGYQTKLELIKELDPIDKIYLHQNF